MDNSINHGINNGINHGINTDITPTTYVPTTDKTLT
jgi:hypothetical protein